MTDRCPQHTASEEEVRILVAAVTDARPTGKQGNGPTWAADVPRQHQTTPVTMARAVQGLGLACVSFDKEDRTGLQRVRGASTLHPTVR